MYLKVHSSFSDIFMVKSRINKFREYLQVFKKPKQTKRQFLKATVCMIELFRIKTCFSCMFFSDGDDFVISV